MQDYNYYSRKKIPFFPSPKVFNTLTREKTVVLDLKLILKYLINHLDCFSCHKSCDNTFDHKDYLEPHTGQLT